VDQYANSVIRKHHEPGNLIASGHDDSEQGREIRELQRSLADRIRNLQRGTQHRPPDETA